MTSSNIISVAIIFILAALIIIINMRKNKKSYASIDEFLDEYGDNIVNALRDAIKILSIDLNNYESQEEYEKAIIEYTVKAIYNNPDNYGIPAELFTIFTEEMIVKLIQNIFSGQKIKSFSVLDTKEIKAHENLIDDQVILARNLEMDDN